jgi:hypothetical protein
VASLPEALRRIKGDLAAAVPEALVRRLLAEAGVAGRDRTLTPVVTTYLALRRALHRAPISGLRHLSGLRFTPPAYCQALARLPVSFFERLQRAVAGRLGRAEPGLWHGRRLFLIDGSSFSMPDTPELQRAFGQPAAQAPGCGFPVAHLLVQFAARTGFAVRTVVAPLRTHDLVHAAATHDALRRGDILVGDRAFASYAHLALLRQRGLHGVFRAHQRRRPGHRRDRFVTYPRPRSKPGWMTEGQYAALPESLLVREVRVTLRHPGLRVRRLVLVTTLLDAVTFPAAMIAAMFAVRWSAEVNLRHLKQTLGLDVLRSKTVGGVTKELHAFVIVYNLVRRVMTAAARRQRVEPDRVSFADALRWLRRARPGAPVPRLIVHPRRPGRYEPRAVKRRGKQYDLLNRPRAELRNRLRANVSTS